MPNQLVSSDRILQNAGYDTELARELAELFQTSSIGLTEELQTALQNADHESLARAAHTFKSPLGFFGADSTVELAQSIETQSDAGENDSLDELVIQLLADVQQVRAELKQTKF